ncbi:MAG: hypothetical protein ACSLEM_06260 [Candidatus Malihini olakiniferum]
MIDIYCIVMIGKKHIDQIIDYAIDKIVEDQIVHDVLAGTLIISDCIIRSGDTIVDNLDSMVMIER